MRKIQMRLDVTCWRSIYEIGRWDQADKSINIIERQLKTILHNFDYAEREKQKRDAIAIPHLIPPV